MRDSAVCKATAADLPESNSAQKYFMSLLVVRESTFQRLATIWGTPASNMDRTSSPWTSRRPFTAFPVEHAESTASWQCLKRLSLMLRPPQISADAPGVVEDVHMTSPSVLVVEIACPTK